jgi:hypothetical protein
MRVKFDRHEVHPHFHTPRILISLRSPPRRISESTTIRSFPRVEKPSWPAFSLPPVSQAQTGPLYAQRYHHVERGHGAHDPCRRWTQGHDGRYRLRLRPLHGLGYHYVVEPPCCGCLGFRRHDLKTVQPICDFLGVHRDVARDGGLVRSIERRHVDGKLSLARLTIPPAPAKWPDSHMTTGNGK